MRAGPGRLVGIGSGSGLRVDLVGWSFTMTACGTVGKGRGVLRTAHHLTYPSTVGEDLEHAYGSLFARCAALSVSVVSVFWIYACFTNTHLIPIFIVGYSSGAPFLYISFPHGGPWSGMFSCLELSAVIVTRRWQGRASMARRGVGKLRSSLLYSTLASTPAPVCLSAAIPVGHLSEGHDVFRLATVILTV